MGMRIGVISDTHGLFDPALLGHFRGVDRIIHAGDIGDGSVIERLEDIAPVIAVSGNIDDGQSNSFPFETVIELEGCRIAVRHIVYEGGKITKAAQAFLDREQPDVCIFGHTHQPKIGWIGNMLLLNPGSAGPKRFKLPRSLGMLFIRNKTRRPRLISMSDRAEISRRS